MQISAGQITIFLLSISIMLFSAKVAGEIFNRFRQPAIIGEIIAGIVLGPTVLGMLYPEAFSILFPREGTAGIALEGIVSLAVVMLLLVSGIEVDLTTVLKQKKAAIYTGLMGILIPFITGFAAAYYFPGILGIEPGQDILVFALFIGTALSISALPVIAKTLMDLKIFNTETGYIIISAAMFNDLVGWLIFSVILGMIGGNGHGPGFGNTLILTLAFTAFVLIIVRKSIDRILPWVQTKLSFPGGVLNLILILGFLGAAFTEYIGIHAIFGAFMIGIAVGDSAHLSQRTRELIHQFVTNIFAPLFFVSIGLKVNFITSFDPVIVIVVLILSFAGKVIGCGLGAYFAGMSRNESLAIGFGMNSRGTMEIILGLLALQFGLIQETVFVALVIMALFTSIASAPMINYFILRAKKADFKDLLAPELVLFTDAANKEEVIEMLADVLSSKRNFNKTELLKSVMEREDLMSTGITNYLAIPHSKIKTEKPAVAVAVNKKGIEFSSEDKLPSRIIILLISPADDNEIQLRLLSEIAAKFGDREKVEKLLQAADKNTFIEELKKI